MLPGHRVVGWDDLSGRSSRTRPWPPPPSLVAAATPELRGYVEQTLKIPKLAQRYWALVQRKNVTMRPDFPLIGHEDMVRLYARPALARLPRIVV